jgi:hypothetical protein
VGRAQTPLVAKGLSMRANYKAKIIMQEQGIINESQLQSEDNNARTKDYQ